MTCLLIERWKVTSRSARLEAGLGSLLAPLLGRAFHHVKRRTARPEATLDDKIRGRGEIAQLVEHSTENRGVGGSSPPLAIRSTSPCGLRPEACRQRSALKTAMKGGLQMHPLAACRGAFQTRTLREGALCPSDRDPATKRAPRPKPEGTPRPSRLHTAGY